MVMVAGTVSQAASPAWSPPHEGSAPREASTERDEQHEVTALQAAAGDGFLERDVHRRGAGVAVTVHVDEDPLHRQGGAHCRRPHGPEDFLVWDVHGPSWVQCLLCLREP